MKRREFLRNTSLASSLIMVPSFVKAFENVASKSLGHKRLVVIQLSGGNDGLNTIIPYNNDIYYNKRPGIAISKNEVIKISDELGFNPGMAPLKNLYDQGYVSIINNVGYPNPSRSHFRSRDIWQTASNSDEFKSTGWVGRFLDENGKHPYDAIEIDDLLSVVMKGDFKNGIATKDANLFFNSSRDPYFKKVLDYHNDEHLSEHNLGYLYKSMIDAKSSAKYIYEKTKTVNSKMGYAQNPFAQQLKTTAEFINSGLETKVFYTSLGGFDTHATQLVRQKKLLSLYSDAVETFVNDLKSQGTFKDTLILTFSEFGRRVKQNAAKGTDHGTANNMYIIGENLNKAGFYNTAPDLKNLDKNGDLKFQVDFRNVYATVLDKWLEVNDKSILNNRSYDKLDFI